MAVISNRNLLNLLARVTDVPGDFVEIGVFRGHTFKRLATIAHALGKTAHAFDSFEGMAPPTDKDLGYYPQGKLSVGGVAAFEQIMRDGGAPAGSYRLWPGFIPHCFDGFDAPVSFALVDVDQYSPTVDAIAWIWPRLSANAILILDDYFHKREGLASLAIDEWLQKQDPIDVQVFDCVDTQLYIQKRCMEPRPLPASAQKG